jgi:hypothetical protein
MQSELVRPALTRGLVIIWLADPFCAVEFHRIDLRHRFSRKLFRQRLAQEQRTSAWKLSEKFLSTCG